MAKFGRGARRWAGQAGGMEATTRYDPARAREQRIERLLSLKKREIKGLSAAELLWLERNAPPS